MLQILEDNKERFSYCMEDIKQVKGEPIEINLNTDKPTFRPPHKLMQVEWDFVQTQLLYGLPYSSSYIDDIVEWSTSFEEHLIHIKEVF